MKSSIFTGSAGVALSLVWASVCTAQAPPTPLPSPSITGPLSSIPPAEFGAGQFGKLAVNGFLSGIGLWQGNHVPGDNSTRAALSNWQVVIQKPDGWLQFYGSEREFDGMPISCGLPKGDEFSLVGGHALGLSEQIAEIPVAAAAAQLSVDRFDDA